MRQSRDAESAYADAALDFLKYIKVKEVIVVVSRPRFGCLEGLAGAYWCLLGPTDAYWCLL
jgi:hypothetical protein